MCFPSGESLVFFSMRSFVVALMFTLWKKKKNKSQTAEPFFSCTFFCELFLCVNSECVCVLGRDQFYCPIGLFTGYIYDFYWLLFMIYYLLYIICRMWYMWLCIFYGSACMWWSPRQSSLQDNKVYLTIPYKTSNPEWQWILVVSCIKPLIILFYYTIIVILRWHYKSLSTFLIWKLETEKLYPALHFVFHRKNKPFDVL